MDAIAWSNSVDLPTPGSPPTSTTPPGTAPPPSTRSSSWIRVGILGSASAWTLVIGVAPLEPFGALAFLVPPPTGLPLTSSSTREFHSPQAGHFPDHLS